MQQPSREPFSSSKQVQTFGNNAKKIVKKLYKDYNVLVFLLFRPGEAPLGKDVRQIIAMERVAKRRFLFFVCSLLLFLTAAGVKDTFAASGEAIPDGVYVISAYKDRNVAMEAEKRGTADKTNVRLAKYLGADHQRFSVTSLGGSRYRIKNLASGKVLDVAGGSRKSGANLQLYAENGTAAQTFTINASSEKGQLVCELIGANSGLAVDYAGAQAVEGTNVRMYTRNHSAGQKWIFTPVADEPQGIDAGVQAGFYKIFSAKSRSVSVGIKNGAGTTGLSPVMCGTGTDDGTIFRIDPTSEGRYRITVASSGLLFAVNGRSAELGTAIVQRAKSGNDEWYIRKASEGSGELIFVCASNPEIVMDLAGGKASEGSSVRCYLSNGSAAQRWILENASDPNTNALPDGIYMIGNKARPERVLEVAGGSVQSGGNVALGGRNKTKLNQLFRIKACGTSGNLYSITNVWSELSLDVAGGRKAAGTNLQQYAENNSPAQLFRIVRVTNSGKPVYKIIGDAGGNAVDIAGGYIHTGTNVQMYPYNASNAQLWYFDKLTAQDRADILIPNDKSNTAIARNARLLQEAVDLTSAAGGGTLRIPKGTFYFGSTGYTVRADAVIIGRDNVTIEGAGMDQTVLKPYGEYQNGLNMFFFAGTDNYITNMDFRNFTIDAAEEKATAYNNQGKGFMFSPLKDCDWENVKVLNTDGTGFGVDLPINCTLRGCVAEGCGKGAMRGSNGASGFGIGIGMSNEESMIIENCISSGNKKYGYFFENQILFSDGRCQAERARGYIVRNCTACDNLYDFGGVRAHDLTYENCRSLPLQNIAGKTDDIQPLHKSFDFRNHSRRISVKDCVIEEPFTDVPGTAGYHDPVYWAYNTGIVDRTAENGAVVFKPDSALTRGLAAEFFYRYEGRPGTVVRASNAGTGDVLTSSFADVPHTSEWYDSAEWIRQEGWADIFGAEGAFEPDRACTRGQFIELLYRYAGSDTGTEEIPADTGGSENEIPASVRWAAEKGIISKAAGTFDIKKAVKRSEAVVWLYRFANR